ncbi:undecaprenyl-phosphate N-acetylglucosaminyl 1-phosphate transferase [Vibrio variabilis]|uniref:Undecaprenyl-phosphate alpha-N-acetylglucosaminyl 1-phosphate transferase n=1 Tax=Vibrio variabilis TaxID=990271 RepID=A0ABQ0J5Y6_9VIBR|nr:undecaprenyl-phosphate N-acetylglucosaminyl 1-phosphate transferase [Vibrio variabilis]
MLTTTAGVLMVSTLSLLSMRKAALHYGFVDTPCARKRHNGEIPLVGGVSLFITIVFLCMAEPELIPFQRDYLISGLVLVFVGMLDDKIDIKASHRLVIMGMLAFWLAATEGHSIDNLGDLTGSGRVDIYDFRVIFTAIALIGCITAFNMVDGADGLLSTLASITFGGLAVIFYMCDAISIMYFCLLFILAMLPYALCNLDVIPRKSLRVFMGDSGSFFIGFTVIWLMIIATQKATPLTTEPMMRPVTALWLIAVPLMDMAMVMLRRLKNKTSPFAADRLHLHHICTRLRLTRYQTLAVIGAIASLHAMVGLLGEYYQIKEWVMLALFLMSFSLYMLSVSYIWKLTRYLRKRYNIR